MRVKIAAAVALAASVAFVVVPGGSAAAKTECNGLFSNTTLNGGVVVKSGDNCDLENVTVNGGLTVNGGPTNVSAKISVNNSTIHGGWSITGNVAPLTYLCGNTVDGGLDVSNVDLGGIALSFGELNSSCPGGTINGGVTIGNDSGPVELDGDRVNGGLSFIGVAGYLNEIEATSVRGTATCRFVFNDESSPGGSANSYTGPDNGCPA